jgi:hypothetical protein
MSEPMFLVGLGVEFYIVAPEPDPAVAPDLFLDLFALVRAGVG